MNGNVTREGITADLEAMARIGIGGAQIFDAGCDIPAGPVEFDSEVWYGLLEHAALEARRLGLELCLSNCSGWSNSGGPWVTPELGMKRVVVESARVRAGEGNRFVSLPKPGNTNGFYRDIAVLAFPTPVAEWKTMESAGGVVMTPTAQKTIVAFPEPFAASGLSARFDFDWYWTCPGKLHVDVSNDGVNFTRRETFELQLAPSGENDHSTRYFVFKERLRAKVFRLMTEFPVLWCPPYERDITSAVANGGQELVLEIRVTNLWPNRLIGDDRLPSDARWKRADFGMALAEFPAWVRRGEGSPTGRHTFTTWQHWTKDDHLLSSGLLGPVRLRVETLIKSPRNGRSSRKEGLYNGQSCS